MNPATISQAYRDLEHEGLVEMRQGAGSFVAAVNAERRTRDRMAAARRIVREMLAEAGRLGIGKGDIKTAISTELDGDSHR